MDHFDLVVIGAGPAGLAAAQRLAGVRHRVALIDGGKPVDRRDRYAAADMTRGHGGAGLFSDGKFSFFPSASAAKATPSGWRCVMRRGRPPNSRPGG
ncbi:MULTISPECIES: FAD-dependent oxidoreductase [unclassified Streptomyces]|uniref:FAD-dependent oxidoreductase n=1 Tax=unclassified Streptomyces TaxID=2593676 RepID=UPI00278C4766|nr:MULTISPECIES: FAD-dependent oxidoreductase [unclassified Streptomyces]